MYASEFQMQPCSWRSLALTLLGEPITLAGRTNNRALAECEVHSDTPQAVVQR